MRKGYIILQAPDESWSVLVEETGTPVRLAGIPQTGLERTEAENLLNKLVPRSAERPRTTELARALSRERAAAA